VGLTTLALVVGNPQGFSFQMGNPDFADIGPSSPPSSLSPGSSSSYRGSKISTGGSNRPRYVVRESSAPQRPGSSPYFRGGGGHESFSSGPPSFSNYLSRPSSSSGPSPYSVGGRPPFGYESEREEEGGGGEEGPQQSPYGGGIVEESDGPSYDDDDTSNYIPSGPPPPHSSGPSFGGSAHKPSLFGSGGPSSYSHEDSPVGGGGRPSYSPSSVGPAHPGGLFGGGQGRFPGGPRGPPSHLHHGIGGSSGSSSFPVRLGRGLMGLLSSAGSSPHFSISPQYFNPPPSPLKYRTMEASSSKPTSFYLEPPTKDAPYFYGLSTTKPQDSSKAIHHSNAPLFRGPRTPSSSGPSSSLLTSATTNSLPQQDYFGLSSISGSSSSSVSGPSNVQQLYNNQVAQPSTRQSNGGGGGLRLVGSPSGPTTVTGARSQGNSGGQYSAGQTVPNPFASQVLRQESAPQQPQQQQQQLIRATGPDGNPVYYQLQGSAANSAQNNVFSQYQQSQQPEQYSTIAAISQVQPEQISQPQQVQQHQQQPQVYQSIGQSQVQSIGGVQPSNFPQGNSAGSSLLSLTSAGQPQLTYSNNEAQVQQSYQPTQYLAQQQQQQQGNSGASRSQQAVVQQQQPQQISQLTDLSQFSFNNDQAIYQQLLQPQNQQQAQQQYTLSSQQQANSAAAAGGPSLSQIQQQQQLLLSQLQQVQQQQQQQQQQGGVQSTPASQQDYLIQPAIQATLTEQQRYQIEGNSGLTSSGNTVQYLTQEPVLAYSTDGGSQPSQYRSSQQTSSQQPTQQQQQQQQQYTLLSASNNSNN